MEATFKGLAVDEEIPLEKFSDRVLHNLDLVATVRRIEHWKEKASFIRVMLFVYSLGFVGEIRARVSYR
jgi:hypothetical protein